MLHAFVCVDKELDAKSAAPLIPAICNLLKGIQRLNLDG